jgi:peroxiredoxin
MSTSKPYLSSIDAPQASDDGLSVALSRREWLATSAAALAAWSGNSAAQTPTEAQLERQAPAMPELGSQLRMPRIELLNGKNLDPSQTAGRPLLIYWWASTCPFCALQSPSMEALWREHQNQGWSMVALSIDRKPEDASAYMARRGYTFPAAWASPSWRQAFPKPKGLPITLLVGRDGRLLLAEKGQMFAEDVQAIGKLLG